ncbi:hypothetical protein [Ectopseudomonas mendocina]|uniref:hypothetical protein n=1 Tax=Ectopseudomonas mendocina TaxID=300 RepID=UPI000F719ED6|nr:hypothetical protein [Pseudomonas mendocina]VEE15387.1 Uncharacterised protein [Pseudomonas mendocina]
MIGGVSFEDALGRKIPFEFFGCDGSDVLVVFLPSVRNKDIYPYYPRISWGREFSKFWNVLYLADPYQNDPAYSKAGGSWYIDRSGRSCLAEVSSCVRELCAVRGFKKVLFYGSSMGGFAALLLALLTENSSAISECPQIFLQKHPASRVVVEDFVGEDVSLYEPLHYLKNCTHRANVKIVCSLHDSHYRIHLLPFLDVLEKERCDIELDVLIYSRERYKKGHVALDKGDAFSLISDYFS